MRIVAKIATAGGAGLSRFPCLPCKVEELTGPDGRISDSRLRAALVMDQVTIGGKDELPELVFGAEYMGQVKNAIIKLSEKVNEDGECSSAVEDCDGDGSSDGSDHRCERNMKRGRFVYCRTDITGCQDGIHAKLTVKNPRGVVGSAELFAYEYAVMCARILLYIKSQIHTTGVVLLEGEGCAGVIEAAKRSDAESEAARKAEVLKIKRANCTNRIGEF